MARGGAFWWCRVFIGLLRTLAASSAVTAFSQGRDLRHSMSLKSFSTAARLSRGAVPVLRPRAAAAEVAAAAAAAAPRWASMLGSAENRAAVLLYLSQQLQERSRGETLGARHRNCSGLSKAVTLLRG